MTRLLEQFVHMLLDVLPLATFVDYVPCLGVCGNKTCCWALMWSPPYVLRWGMFGSGPCVEAEGARRQEKATGTPSSALTTFSFYCANQLKSCKEANACLAVLQTLIPSVGLW